MTKLQKGTALLENIIKKSWEDEAFKQELIDNPVAAIEKLSKKKYNLKEKTIIKVEDQSNESYIYLNIPRKVNIDDFELSDKELEYVSGGMHPVVAWFIGNALWDVFNGAIDGIRDANNNHVNRFQ